MSSRRQCTVVAVVASLASLIAVANAFGALAATATISATPDGPNYDYTVTLTNTGSADIGTFWFAWTPPGQPFEYDFLPSGPIPTGQPGGWLGLASLGFPGYSIESYNYLGSPISPGGIGMFQFTTSDTPTQLQESTLGFPNTTSFIYEGAPEVGAPARVDPVFDVPEASSSFLMAMGCTAAGLRRRCRQTPLPQPLHAHALAESEFLSV
jgi:hypothetical protein